MNWSSRRTPRASTTARGYGATHQRLRKVWAIQVQAGRVDCWRCEQRINPNEPWHLGHDDNDRRITRGPEHTECNLGAAGRKAQRLQREPTVRRMTRW